MSVLRSVPGLLGNAGKPPLPKWKAAQALRAAGVRNAIFLVVGDSTAAGRGGANTSASTNDESYSWPRQIASLLPNGSNSSLWGDYNSAIWVPLSTFDQRVTLGSWVQTANSTTATIGGPVVRCNSPSTSAFTFTPLNQVDTFVVYCYQTPGLGIMNIGIDSNTPTSFNAAGTDAVVPITVTAALGNHTVKISRVSGGTVAIAGIIAYNSASKETTVINGGWSSSLAATWLSTGSSLYPVNTIPQVAPDLSIICLTINDWVAATSTSAYTASIQQLINICKQTGDVILMSGAASEITEASVAQQQIYINIVQALAASNNLRFINMTALMGSWATNNALGWEFDGLHPNANYYTPQATLIASAIAA